jgi:hypothetical protein
MDDYPMVADHGVIGDLQTAVGAFTQYYGWIVPVRRGAGPLRVPAGGTADVREDAHLREPRRPVLRGDRVDWRADRHFPPAFTHLALIDAALSHDEATDRSTGMDELRLRLDRRPAPVA